MGNAKKLSREELEGTCEDVEFDQVVLGRWTKTKMVLGLVMLVGALVVSLVTYVFGPLVAIGK